MERKIIFPKWEENEILCTHVENELENKGGMIVVYDREGNAIGHVVLFDDVWTFKTAKLSVAAESLGEIMVDYNYLIFKLIN